MKTLASVVLWAVCLLASSPTHADDTISLSLKQMEIESVMEMLARKYRINILLGDSVEGTVSLNLYDVSRDEAVRAIAEAAGFAVEKRRNSYFILPSEQVGRFSNGVTSVRRFPIHYADAETVAEMLAAHTSDYGEVTAIPERSVVVVSDKAEFLARMARLVSFVDAPPQQVLIEAQILEVTLTDEDAYGIDWSKLFASDGGDGNFGVRGLAGAGNSANSGFLFELVTPNVDVQLSALQQEGRVRTLSTPKLMALDNQEASVIIGDRRGYQVTTTINQVTSESIEFLESGVILRVTPKIDPTGRILMDIHPEVSTGTVDANGIPSQTTTEVTTSLLVPDGETVFIGGLIKHTQSQSYQRVPLLGRVPGIKGLFRSKERTNVNTETVVLITPKLVDDATLAVETDQMLEQTRRIDEEFDTRSRHMEQRVLHEEARLLDDPHKLPERDQAEAAQVEPNDTDEPTAIANVPDVDDFAAIGPALEEAAPRSNDPIGKLFSASTPLADSGFGVQVMMMSSADTTSQFIEKHGLDELIVVPEQRRSGIAYALLLGVYPTLDEARRAASERPALFVDEPWIRSMAELNARRPAEIASSN